MKTLFISHPVSDDLMATIFAIHEEVFRPHIEKIWGWHPDWQQQNFSSNWQLCETSAIKDERSSAIVGYMQLLQHDDHLQVKNLAILPSHQGQGIGSALVRDLQVRAQQQGLSIKLSVFTTNKRAEKFYRRLGFQNEQRDAQFQHMIWDLSR